MRSCPVLPVMTGKTTTRKRSTSPAWSKDRHKERLPTVRNEGPSSSFIARTASTGSSSIKRLLVHANGSFRVEENTSFDILVSSAKLGSSEVTAKSDINRYVVAPISI